MVHLFVSPSDPAASVAISGFPLFAAGFVFFIVNLTSIGYFQSIERIRPATTFAMLRGFALLVPSFCVLPLCFGNTGIWLAMPVSEALTTPKRHPVLRNERKNGGKETCRTGKPVIAQARKQRVLKTYA